MVGAIVGDHAAGYVEYEGQVMAYPDFRIKRGTNDEALANKLYSHFCTPNKQDAETTPEASGTLCLAAQLLLGEQSTREKCWRTADEVEAALGT